MNNRESKIPTEDSRSTREVFEDHLELRQAHDLEADLARNYSPDVVVLTSTGTFRGLDGVRESASELQKYFPNGNYTYHTRLVEGEVAFLVWSGESPVGEVKDGADSFVIRDGKIVVQTIQYTVDRES